MGAPLSPLSYDRLRKLRDLLDRSTPGPWGWFGNGRNSDVYLATVDRGRQYIMGFERWGMRGAQPTFRVNSRMVPASALVTFEVGDQSVRGMEAAKADESVYRYDVRGIDAPDAALIPAAINALRPLLDERDRLVEAAATAADLLDQYAGFIRDDVRADDLERHPYLPLIKDTVAALRALSGTDTGEKVGG